MVFCPLAPFELIKRRYGCDIWSGGTDYSAVDNPGRPLLRGDCPRRDRSTNVTQIKPGLHLPVSVDHLKLLILIPWTLEPPANCGLFAIAFATALAYGEQPGHCLFDQNKVRQHQLKPLQDGEMTPLPLKKNRRNGRRVKTWNTIQIRCTCRMLTVWERVSCMTGLLFASERLQYMLPRFIVDCL